MEDCEVYSLFTQCARALLLHLDRRLEMIRPSGQVISTAHLEGLAGRPEDISTYIKRIKGRATIAPLQQVYKAPRLQQ